jgi:dihydroorotate dehydrogenase
LAGLSFSNPLGLAAGYDKNADVPEALLRLGFGFVEIGTVTPLPQPGNPKPRVFRLVEDQAIINRYGFNSKGHAHVFNRLNHVSPDALIGVNIGANKTSPDRMQDYVAGIAAFAAVARYFTANISSPNTPGLRDLQAKDSLAELLAAILAERDRQTALQKRHIPVFLKIAPDMTEQTLDDITGVVLASALDGMIISNTTLSRDGVTNAAQAKESGGLSGRPLFERSTIILAKMRQRLGQSMPLIGVGGVSCPETAAEKIRAGADLVQLYTSMVYGGPALPGQIVRGLSDLCDREGLSHLSQIRDTRMEDWANRSI